MEARMDSGWAHEAAGQGQRSGTRMALREVVLHSLRQQAPGNAVLDLRQLSQRNDHVLGVVQACCRVDASRRNLSNTFETKTTLDDVAHLLEARVAAGTTDVQALNDLVQHHRPVMERALAEAMSEWHAAGSHFTRLTRFLPSQLDKVAVRLVRREAHEIERLAQASAIARLQMPFRPGQAGAFAVGQFASAKAAYLRALEAFDLSELRWKAALGRREVAEAGFRFGAQGAQGFAEAVVRQHDARRAMLGREFNASMALYALYALALQLPEQFAPS